MRQVAAPASSRTARAAGDLNLRILVVDDPRHTRGALALGLSLLGVDVQTAALGEEALERLKARPADWLVSDVRMQGMSGIDLAARCAAGPATADDHRVPRI